MAILNARLLVPVLTNLNSSLNVTHTKDRCVPLMGNKNQTFPQKWNVLHTHFGKAEDVTTFLHLSYFSSGRQFNVTSTKETSFCVETGK